MESAQKQSGFTTDKSAAASPPLHTVQLMRRTHFCRIYIIIYTFAILALLYNHSQTLYHSTSLLSSLISITLLISDLCLAFEWSTSAALRFGRVRRKQFPENLPNFIKRNDYPGIDVFICTADPYKEPPVDVVNTALSVLAYDYPPEKLSVYLSDDGGSDLTLFAFFEAAKFAAHWLPFCSDFNIKERSPKAFFQSDYSSSAQIEKLKLMYECMKGRIENVVEKGEVGNEYMSNDKERQVFSKWTPKFTPQSHPSLIQVLLDNRKDKDVMGHNLPNLVYVSREKSNTAHHHFKAGALNSLIRVSAVMTNAPIILSIDCDNYSNDPQTLERILCYFGDPKVRSEISLIQFPQLFVGLNKNDIYAGEYKSLFQIFPHGYDGIRRMFFYGSNGFFSRRAFFGPPSKLLPTPEMPQLNPFHLVNNSIQSQDILTLATRASSCHFENHTDWGIKKGFRYGSVVEDYFTGYMLHCEGWRGVFCQPERPAFLAEATTSLLEVLVQQKRWAVGLLEVVFSKYCPVTFGLYHGFRNHVYSQQGFWAIWSIPITVYSFLPQLALLNNLSIFPEVKSPWFLLYAFLFVSAYAVDMMDFMLHKGTICRWWNDQRMWNIRGLSTYSYAIFEFTLKSLGMSTPGFTLTSKAVDEQISKRYEKGLFEFGVASPMFVPLVMAASMNLLSFSWGAFEIAKGNSRIQGLAIQMFLSAFAVVNSFPIYQAMVLRSDNGKIPAKITVIGTGLTWAICVFGSFIFK
ncbi:cellulose synthase-like protein G3 [Euphorbia lathyris]|uniref:cellulose synthase-like protein G3 n=1 Tax=Euphorbia lathyris TaxID=212925 RepID=UPI0033141E51